MSRILIVDDERPLLRTLGAHLERHGYDVDLVDNGEAAVTRGSSGCSRPRDRRRGPARDRRRRRRARAASPDDDADHRAVGSARRVLEDPGAGRRCRRLRDEAVRAWESCSHGCAPSLDAPSARRRAFRSSRRRISGSTSPRSVPPADDGTEIVLTPTQWRLVEVLVAELRPLGEPTGTAEEVWGPTFVNQTNYIRQFMAQLRREVRTGPGAAPLLPDPTRAGRAVRARPRDGSRRRRSALDIVEREVQLEHVHGRLAENAERPPVGVVLDQGRAPWRAGGHERLRHVAPGAWRWPP